jgi:excisionase family DNA binding protein
MRGLMALPCDTQTAPLFLTPAELAERWKICTLTLLRWRKAGKLKTHHLGRGIRFAMAEIERIEREAQAQ